MVNSLLQYLVELNICLASLGIVFLPKLIYAALCLSFVLINVGLLYLLLHADFLAAAQVLIYVGAVNVLIVFAIMLIQSPNTAPRPRSPLGQVVTAIVTIVLLGAVCARVYAGLAPEPTSSISLGTDLSALGRILLTDFLLPFEVLSILLLMALIGAIGLARKPEPNQGPPS